MKSVARLVVLYAVFSFIAIAVNIVCQAPEIWVYKDVFAVQMSAHGGTAAWFPL